MAEILLQGIHKEYPGGVVAVQDFNLEIAHREFIVLVGPSGCGKSTTLRMIAGLEEITRGELYIGGKLVNRVPPKDRDIAMVFQNYALYPHMTVYKNMAFGLQLRRVPKGEIKARVEEAAKALDILHLLERKPKALSGGQRQRVALGRAMVRDPAVFLLDEPLSNLDAKLRTTMRAEISKLHRRLGTTFVYVTHDQTEAMTMGDRIVVMKDGFIQQVDTPQRLYDHPVNMFVAGFIGTPQMNFFPALLAAEGDRLLARCAGAEVALPRERFCSGDLAPCLDREVVLGVRPEDLHPPGAPAPHTALLETAVELAEPLGAEMYLHLALGEHKCIARVPPGTPIPHSGAFPIAVDCTRLHLFHPDTGQALPTRAK